MRASLCDRCELEHDQRTFEACQLCACEQRDEALKEVVRLRKKIFAIVQHVSELDIEKVIHPLPLPVGAVYVTTWFSRLIELLKE